MIEAFSARYTECNPNLFASDGAHARAGQAHTPLTELLDPDQAYVLAFSLIMLHTDAFNKSNKRKMTKADYVKNTRLPGVAPEVLDVSTVLGRHVALCSLIVLLQYFYDNIVFAPFIFIEDPLDINGQLGLVHESSRGTPTTTPHMTPGGSSMLLKSPKIDPYYLITQVRVV